MAKREISESIKTEALIDWRIGKLSQRDIADKYKISVGYVAKITKGVARDLSQVVSAGVAYNQGLIGNNEQIVSAIKEVVSDEVRFRLENDAHLRLIQNKANTMLDAIDKPSDALALMTLTVKHREARLGRSPDTAIQINTNGAQVKTLDDFYRNA